MALPILARAGAFLLGKAASKIIPKIVPAVRSFGAKVVSFGAGRAASLPARVPGIVKVGRRFIGAIGTAVGGEAIASAITGRKPSFMSKRTALAAAGFAVGGIPGAIVGTLSSGMTFGGRGISAAKNVIEDIPGITTSAPGDIFTTPPSMDIPQTTFQPEIAASPAAAFSPAFAPSASYGISPQVMLGGGGADMGFLLLALLGGAGAGFLAGKRRRRKKRKKYKGAKR